MSDYPRKYYRAEGRSLAAIHEWCSRRDAQWKAWREFQDRNGAESCFVSDHGMLGGRHLIGLNFPEGATVPKGWRQRKDKRSGDTCWVPARSTKEGNALDREMREMPHDTIPDDVGKVYWEGFRYFTTGIHKHGDVWVIVHHEKADPPPDAVPMKASEYWRLAEEHAEAKGEVSHV